MMGIINSHHSTEQQAGLCSEKLHSVRQNGPKDHGQMQQHETAMKTTMQWSPFNSPLFRGASALHRLWSTPEAVEFQLKGKISALKGEIPTDHHTAITIHDSW